MNNEQFSYHYTNNNTYNTGGMFINTQVSTATAKEMDVSFQHYSGPSSATLSPFSTSPDDSDLQYSCEDLNNAFSQTSIDPSFSSSSSSALICPIIGEQQEEPLVDDVDYETAPSSTTGISLDEMLRHFPDLPSFIYHKDFPVFSDIWLEFQKNTTLAREPANRLFVQSWLESAALQIHFLMVTIVKTTTATKADVESEPRRMFSALRRLKDRIEIMHQVFQIIEKGRVMFGQSPSAAIAPLIEAAMKIKRDVSYFANNSKVIPVIKGDEDVINLVNPDEVTMTELSNRVIDTYNLMPYNNKSTTTAANNLIMSAGSDSEIRTPLVTTTSFQPDEQQKLSSPPSCITPAAYIHRQQQDLLSNQNEPFFQPTTTNQPRPPTNDNHPFSHIQPSWIHYVSSTWSLPVTPSERHTQQQFLSLPATPTCTQEASSVEETGTVCTPCNTVRDLSLSPYQANSPLNTISEDNSSSNSDYDLDDEMLDSDIEEEDDDDNIMIEDDDDEEYIVSDGADDEDWKEETMTTRRRSKRTTTTTITTTTKPPTRRSNRGASRKRNNVVTKELRKAALAVAQKEYTRRTATSYDAQTTHYLKSIFFDIYSSRDKLTKDQRRQVQKETGLKPRNITYWFSNHKRRFQNSLLVFKKTVKESQGSVKTYDDFLEWRRSRGLSEEVLENEHLDLIDNNNSQSQSQQQQKSNE